MTGVAIAIIGQQEFHMATEAREAGTKSCPHCGEQIKATARFCVNCRAALDAESAQPLISIPTAPVQVDISQADELPAAGSLQIRTVDSPTLTARPAVSPSSLYDIADRIASRGLSPISSNAAKTLGWFLAVNAALLVTIVIVALLVRSSEILVIWPILLVVACAAPFYGLAISKSVAERAFGAYRADNSNPQERDLCRIVEVLARRAGLPVTPEVWIYPADEINAFATGPNKNNAMVLFTTGTLTKIDSQGIAAIAGHELTHIANGDMQTMTIVQSVVNVMSQLILLPLWFAVIMFSALSGCMTGALGWFADFGRWFYEHIKNLVRKALLFLGELLVMFFSRSREYVADAGAAQLVDRDSMISALRQLSRAVPALSPKQQPFAALMINAAPNWSILFSSHPTIEDRIAKLMSHPA